MAAVAVGARAAPSGPILEVHGFIRRLRPRYWIIEWLDDLFVNCGQPARCFVCWFLGGQ